MYLTLLIGSSQCNAKYANNSNVSASTRLSNSSTSDADGVMDDDDNVVGGGGPDVVVMVWLVRNND